MESVPMTNVSDRKSQIKPMWLNRMSATKYQ